jgi:hypothetical protein
MSYQCVPLYDSLGENAVEYIINHSEAVVTFAEAKKLPNLAKAAKGVAGQLKHVVYWGGAADAAAVEVRSSPGSSKLTRQLAAHWDSGAMGGLPRQKGASTAAWSHHRHLCLTACVDGSSCWQHIQLLPHLPAPPGAYRVFWITHTVWARQRCVCRPAHSVHAQHVTC